MYARPLVSSVTMSGQDQDTIGSSPEASPESGVTYRDAGVDLSAAADTMTRIRDAVTSTYGPRVLQGIGAFGGLFELPGDVPEPVLVASTDGVGTKTRVGAALGQVHGLGRDLVNHCVNDVLVQGATPLFFLDYIASARLEPALVADVVGGVAEACREAGMALLGGETAEMPGVYAPGELDLVGTIVGIVAKSKVINGSSVREGDVLLALPSGGLQTNGFSLARTVVRGRYQDPVDPADPDGPTMGEALLAPHRSFLKDVRPLLDAGLVRALVHVTGGGIPGNLPRVLPEGLGAVVDPTSWAWPPVFRRLQQLGEIDEVEMRIAFNLGVGMIVILRPEDEARARELSPALAWRIGEVVAGEGVRFEASAAVA